MRHAFTERGSLPGVARCACGAERMMVARIVGCVPTMRALALYRYPLLTCPGKPRGVLRAKGWAAWSTVAPHHAPAWARARRA